MPGFTTRPVFLGTHGVVAAGHYLAATAGLRMFERGGNAIDAGVAAGFALNVLKPQSNGIAGEAPVLLWLADQQRAVAINGQGCAPRRATIRWFREQGIELIPGDGLLPATVPAAYGAWVTALMIGGRLRLRDVLEPAIELAESGFPVYPALRAVIQRQAERFRTEWPSSAEVYLPGGRVPELGEVFRQTDWANTFKQAIDVEGREAHRGREAALQAALDWFYKGPVAERIGRFAKQTAVRDATGLAHHGLLEYQDLANFRTKVEEPISFTYRGVTVCKCNTWSQGAVFLQQLALLEGYDLRGLGHNSAEYIHTVVEAAKLAFADREQYYGDPDFVRVPLERLLSREYAAERRRLIDPARASLEFRPGEAPPTMPVRPGDAALDEEAACLRGDVYVGDHGGDTTHLDAVDAQGNMMAATPSGGWMPSSPVIPGLGFPLGTRGQMFWLDESKPNALGPGKRPRTTLTPSLALKEGRPWLAFGTPGGDFQDQWTLQFFLNVVDFEMDLQEACDAPTFHIQHFPSSFYPRATYPGRVVIESRVPAAVLEDLRARGHEVIVTGAWANGQVTGIRFNPQTGVIEGAASPRGQTAYVMGW